MPYNPHGAMVLVDTLDTPTIILVIFKRNPTFIRICFFKLSKSNAPFRTKVIGDLMKPILLHSLIANSANHESVNCNYLFTLQLDLFTFNYQIMFCATTLSCEILHIIQAIQIEIPLLDTGQYGTTVVGMQRNVI